MYTSSVVLLVCTGLYTTIGGMLAVMWTEILQSVILLAGGLGLLLVTLNSVGGWTSLTHALPQTYWSVMLPMNDPDYPWTGLAFGYPILSLWYWCGDQVMVQRTLAAHDLKEAQKGCVLCGFLKALPPFLFVVPGMAARLLFPEEVGQNTNMAYPLLVTRLLPPGILGLMVAAILAALMSSLAAVMNSASTIITMDFYAHLRPQASNSELVLAGRLGTGVVTILGLLWLPIIPLFSTELWTYVQSITSYLAPSISVVFIAGVFWDRANSQGALASLCMGLVLAAVRIVLEPLSRSAMLPHPISPVMHVLQWMARCNFLHLCILYFAICAGVLIAVSLCTPPPPYECLAGLTWTHQDAPVTCHESVAPLDLGEEMVGDELFVEVPLDPDPEGPVLVDTHPPTDPTPGAQERCASWAGAVRQPQTLGAAGLLVCFVALVGAFSIGEAPDGV